MDDTNSFYNDIAALFEGLNDIAKSQVPYYRAFADDVVRGRITDIDQIEHELDSMVTFCFNEEILLLYKSVLRRLYKKNPETVDAYVRLYYDMYENNEDYEEEDIENAKQG